MTRDELTALGEEMGARVRDAIAKATQDLERRVAQLEARPKMEYRGVYQGGTKYQSGDVVTHQGGLWMAKGETAANTRRRHHGLGAGDSSSTRRTRLEGPMTEYPDGVKLAAGCTRQDAAGWFVAMVRKRGGDIYITDDGDLALDFRNVDRDAFGGEHHEVLVWAIIQHFGDDLRLLLQSEATVQ